MTKIQDLSQGDVFEVLEFHENSLISDHPELNQFQYVAPDDPDKWGRVLAHFAEYAVNGKSMYGFIKSGDPAIFRHDIEVRVLS